MLCEKEIDEMERRFPEMARGAFAEAYRRTLAAGHSVLVSENGFIHEVFPDVVKGGKLTIQ
jgi:hypothetical protein